MNSHWRDCDVDNRDDAGGRGIDCATDNEIDGLNGSESDDVTDYGSNRDRGSDDYSES